MKKIIIIESCAFCPNLDFDGDREDKWGKSWCDLLDRELPTMFIPEDCPLETYNESKTPEIEGIKTRNP